MTSRSPRAGLARLALVAGLACPAALAGALAWAPDARAQAQPERIVLFVDPGLSDLDPEAVRRAVQAELGAEVVLAGAPPPAGGLAVSPRAGGGVVLTYRAGDRVTERALDLPGDPAAAIETLALLAGNVVRDEAGELLAELAARRRKPGPPPPPPAGTSPGPAPAVTPSHSTPPVTPSHATPPVTPRPAPSAIPPRPAPAATPRSPAPFEAEALPCDREGLRRVPVGVDFVPMIGSSLIQGTRVVRTLSFNVLGGLTGGLRGFELASVLNIDTEFACGVQLSGGANWVGGHVRGAQIASIANLARGPVRGAQLSGGINIAIGPLLGVQVGTIANYALGGRGVQLASANITAGPIDAQLGVANISQGPARFQFGALNYAAPSDVSLGVANISQGPARFQLGAFNYAQTSDFSLGLLTIVRDGRTHLDVWGTSWGLVSAGVKHGGERFHNLYGLGLRPWGGKTLWAAVLGFGLRFPISDLFYVDTDLVTYSLHSFDTWSPVVSVGELRVPIGVRLDRRFALYAGPAYSVALAATTYDAELGPSGISAIHDDVDVVVRGWPGAVFGLQGF